uniref:Uncharacterized protein n=1 Tax=Sphaerodactylus townsendi TaxID=933632 RepID=A0ACB8GBE5_9SAUR
MQTMSCRWIQFYLVSLFIAEPFTVVHSVYDWMVPRAQLRNMTPGAHLGQCPFPNQSWGRATVGLSLPPSFGTSGTSQAYPAACSLRLNSSITEARIKLSL